jgi:hypothetical protein
MKMEHTQQFCLSGAWLFEPSPELAVLRRPGDGSVIELSDVDIDRLASLWSAASLPHTLAELRHGFEAFGASGFELLELFQSEAVLRPLAEPTPIVGRAVGVLPELVAELGRHGGWQVGPIQCFSFADVLGAPEQHASAALGLASLGESVIAVGLGCAHCAMLRVLGVLGEPASEQTERVRAAPLAPPRELRAMIAMALAALQAAPLAPMEGLWVRSDEGLERGSVLPHPDCPRCAESSRPVPIAGSIAALLDEAGAVVQAEPIARALGDSPFAPLRVDEVDGAPGQFPFDAPYVFGDTRLSRSRLGRIFCVSIPGITHGSDRSAAFARMLAWSEGAERLGAQGAIPDRVLAADDPRIVEAYRPFGGVPHGAETRAVTIGLDLLRDAPCLVPFERVAVAVPRELMWGGVECESTFTGCSSHIASLTAILHATVELLKRDAYVIAWYRKRRLAAIEWPRELPPDLDERASYLRRHGLELRLYDLRADLPLPMLLLHVRSTRHNGHFPAGGSLLVPAGGFTAQEALQHALKLTCSRFAGLAYDDSPDRDPLNPDAVAALGRVLPFWPGLARYLDPQNAAAFDFLPGGPRIELGALDAGEIVSPFQALRTWLQRAELTWLAVSLNTSASLEAGLRVLKVLVPEALRLSLRDQEMDRAHPRLARDWPGSTPGSWHHAPLPIY